MADTNELYILISVLVTLTFTEGHRNGEDRISMVILSEVLNQSIKKIGMLLKDVGWSRFVVSIGQLRQPNVSDFVGKTPQRNTQPLNCWLVIGCL